MDAKPFNSVLYAFQAMSFVPTVRDFFLREENYKDIKMPSGDISLILGIHNLFTVNYSIYLLFCISVLHSMFYIKSTKVWRTTSKVMESKKF